MRLLSYAQAGGWHAGIDAGEQIIDVVCAAEAAGWDRKLVARVGSTRGLLELGERAHELGELPLDRLEAAGALRDRDGLRIGPPVPDPQKIICLGLNYRDHAEEAGLQAPAAPMFFAKFPNSLIGPRDAIVPPATTDQVDYEAELAVVIGRSGRHIAESDALDHVAGAMAFNDVSARDLQLANNLWTGGKAIDTFAPCGPLLVPLEEVPDIQSLSIRTRVNGEVVQDSSTAAMIFGVAEVISFLSRIMTLAPGDIIATGTPAGVGNARTPKLFLTPGDTVEVEIEAIGALSNPVENPF